MLLRVSMYTKLNILSRLGQALVFTSCLIISSLSLARNSQIDPSLEDLKSIKVSKPDHVIFFLHGLQGSAGTFAQFKEVIEKEYGDKVLVGNLTYPTSPVNCNIQGNDWVHPFHFAKVVNSKITHFYYEHAKAGIVDINTPYSIVAHSQGGLVAMIHLNTCMKNDRDTNSPWCRYRDGLEIYNHLVRPENTETFNSDEFKARVEELKKIHEAEFNNLKIKFDESIANRKFAKKYFFEEYPGCKVMADHYLDLVKDLGSKQKFLQGHPAVPNIKNFISLGSPFWGSATANRGQSIKDILDYGGYVIDIDKYAPLEQLMRLAVGSRGTSWQRNFFLNRNATYEWNWTEDTQWQSPYPEGLKVYNLSGDLAENYNLWQKTTGVGLLTSLIKAPRFESDVIVGSPAARLDTIFNIENIKKEAPAFKGVTNITEGYYATKLAHIPVMGITGMTEVTEENYKTHPSYILVSRVLDNTLNNTNNPIFSNDEIEEHFSGSLENFNSEIKLITPKGYHRKFAIQSNQVTISPDNPERFKKLNVTNTLYAKGFGPNNEAVKMKHHYYQTYYHIGKMEENYIFDPKMDYNNFNPVIEEAAEYNSINYEFNIHGFELKTLRNYVAPSYSTYTEGYLKPYQPIQNNQITGVDDKVARVVGILSERDQDSVMQRRAKVFRLTEDNKIQLERIPLDELTDDEFNLIKDTKGRRGRCFVGSVGHKTPNYFRHQVLDEIQVYDDNGRKIKKEDGGRPVVPKMRHIQPDEWNMKQDPTTGEISIKLQYEELTGGLLYEKYASNKNYTYKKFDDDFTRAEKNLLVTGDIVEILGRYSTGFVDPDSDVGRNCHQDEIKWAKEGRSFADPHCANNGLKGNIDRYLVTSPKIRLNDGLSEHWEDHYEFANIPYKVEVNNSFHKLKSDGNGGIIGARWVNVQDIDIFKNDVPVRNKLIGTQAFYGYTIIPEGRCLMDDRQDAYIYPSPGSIYLDYYTLE